MHTGGVDIGYLGIGLVLVVGIAVVAYGWLADRTDTKRRQDALTQAPDRPIPGHRTDAPSPAYVTEHEALHGPAKPSTLQLTDDARTRLQQRLSGAPSLAYGYADPVFANDPATGLCVLTRPRILVAADEVTTVRELLSFLEKSSTAKRSVVVVAPGFAKDVLATLAVNASQRTLECVALVIPDAGQRRALCSLVGATPLSRQDLRSGYVPPSLGTCETWVSSAERLWILPEEAGGPS